MGSTTKLTFADFLLLPEDGQRYELNEGELLVTPSATMSHGRVRIRLVRALMDFVEGHGLGEIIDETDFHISPNTVRRPDAAFIANRQLEQMDQDRSPLEGVPTLAIEIISPTNSAADMAGKVRQYLKAGCEAVWVLYPSQNLVVVHDARGMREFRDSLVEEKLFPGLQFTLDLSKIFSRKSRK